MFISMLYMFQAVWYAGAYAPAYQTVLYTE